MLSYIAGPCPSRLAGLTCPEDFSIKRRVMKRVLAMTLLAAIFGWPAVRAQSPWDPAANFPSKPIRWIMPFPPGGPSDTVARIVGQRLSARLKQPVLVDNRAGASGNIGMEAAARAAPDGYTIVLNTIPLVTNQSLFDKLGWDPIRDFSPIGIVATAPHVLVVPAKVPGEKVDELIQPAPA